MCIVQSPILLSRDPDIATSEDLPFPSPWSPLLSTTSTSLGKPGEMIHPVNLSAVRGVVKVRGHLRVSTITPSTLGEIPIRRIGDLEGSRPR